MNAETPSGRLAGKRVLITGTAGGQGAAAQRAFCEAGASVVGCDISPGGAEKVAAELAAEGYTAHGRAADLSDPAAAREWVEWGVETLGGLDVLYNNAGSAEFAPFAEMTREVWDHTIRHELDIVFDVTVAAWKHLSEGGGSVINVSSVCGLIADGTLAQSAHAAAKAGVISLTRQLAAEGGPLGIRVNCISPGVIMTPALEDQSPAMLRHFTDCTFLGRLGTPAEIVPAAIYFASDESSFATGANLVIDGGWSAGTPLVDLGG